MVWKSSFDETLLAIDRLGTSNTVLLLDAWTVRRTVRRHQKKQCEDLNITWCLHSSGTQGFPAATNPHLWRTRGAPMYVLHLHRQVDIFLHLFHSKKSFGFQMRELPQQNKVSLQKKAVRKEENKHRLKFTCWCCVPRVKLCC